MENIESSVAMPPGGKLRLAHVIQFLDPAAGGGAVTAVRSTCAALAERGHDVTLYATDSHPERIRESQSYRTLAFPMEFSAMAISFEFARAFRRLKGVDLVHIHQLYRFPQSFAAFFCRRHNIPYCIQPHGSLDPTVYFKRERRKTKRLYEILIENRNLQHAAGLIYTAQGEKEAADFLKLKPPTFVVPLGLDISQFDRNASGFRGKWGLQGKEFVAFMGRIVPVKRLDLLIAAFAALAPRRPDAVLVLAGPDTECYAATLRQLMARLNLAPGRVIFTGMLEGAEKLALLNEADIFAMPSRTENFALAAVEAMAMGTPVIVSDGVKIAPDIHAAGAGLVIMPDAIALEEAITKLLDDKQRRAQMGAAARRLAESYSWSQVTGNLEDAYRRMIGA